MKAAAAAPTIEVLAAGEFRVVVHELAELLVDAVGSGASVGFLPPFTVVQAERWWRGLTDDVATGRLLVLLLRVDGRAFGTAQLRLAQLPNAQHRQRLQRFSFTAPRGVAGTAGSSWRRSKTPHKPLAAISLSSTR
jgi:hypothetical protein